MVHYYIFRELNEKVSTEGLTPKTHITYYYFINYPIKKKYSNQNFDLGYLWPNSSIGLLILLSLQNRHVHNYFIQTCKILVLSVNVEFFLWLKTV